jgi:hypothetical protein
LHTTPTQAAPTHSLSFHSLRLGPTGQSPPPFFPVAISLLLIRFLNRKNQIENGKWLNRQRKFSNNISLKSSRRGESIEVIDFENGAVCITRVKGEEDWVRNEIGRPRGK